MFPILKVLLVVSNFLLLGYVLRVIWGHYCASYNMESWSTLFHVLCVIWLIIRGYFWVFTIESTENWTTMGFHILYWMPNPFQFAAFALLPLFFAQIHTHALVWKRYWLYIRPIYIILICVICMLQVVWSILAGLNDDCAQPAHVDPVATQSEDPSTQARLGLMFSTFKGVLGAAGNEPNGREAIRSIHYHSHDNVAINNDHSTYDNHCMDLVYSSVASRLVSGLLFSGLALLQGNYGYSLSSMAPSQYRQYFTRPVHFMTVVNGFLTLAFLSRALYNFSTLYGHDLLPAIPLQGTSDVPLPVFIFYEVWDYIPTLLLLLSVTGRPLGHPGRRDGHRLWTLMDYGATSDGGLVRTHTDDAQARLTPPDKRSPDGRTGSPWWPFSELLPTLRQTERQRAPSVGYSISLSAVDEDDGSLSDTSIESGRPSSARHQNKATRNAAVTPLHGYQDARSPCRSRAATMSDRFTAPDTLEPVDSWLVATFKQCSQHQHQQAHAAAEAAAGSLQSQASSVEMSSSNNASFTREDFLHHFQPRPYTHARPGSFGQHGGPPSSSMAAVDSGAGTLTSHASPLTQPPLRVDSPASDPSALKALQASQQQRLSLQSTRQAARVRTLSTHDASSLALSPPMPLAGRSSIGNNSSGISSSSGFRER